MFRDIPLHPSSSIVQAMQSPRESIKLMEASLKPPLLTTTLFLGDLSVVCTEMSLRELFSKYGELERVQLKKSDRDPQRAHLGFGFVKFSTRESAERALEELNGKFFLGRALRVGWADDHNRIGVIKASDPKKNHQTAQLHVSFTSRADKIVSEMDLGGVFSGFGNVVDIAIKKNVLNRESGVQSGYAFVHFSLTLAGLQSALTASERVNNCTIDDITYKCKTDQALVMQYMSLKSSEPSSPHNDFSRASSPAMHDFVRAPSPVFRDYSRAPSPASRDFAHAPSPRAPSPAFRDFSRAPSPATHDFVRAPSHDYANAPSSTFLAGVADPREPLTRLEDGIVCSKPKPIPYPLTFPSYDKTLESPRMSSYESPRINSYHEHKGENLTSPARHTFKTYGGDRTPPTGHSKAGVFTFPSVSRSCSSSLKENDYQSTVLYPSLSISSSVSYDEYPSYRRGGIMKDFYYPTIQE